MSRYKRRIPLTRDEMINRPSRAEFAAAVDEVWQARYAPHVPSREEALWASHVGNVAGSIKRRVGQGWWREGTIDEVIALGLRDGVVDHFTRCNVCCNNAHQRWGWLLELIPDHILAVPTEGNASGKEYRERANAVLRTAES